MLITYRIMHQYCENIFQYSNRIECTYHPFPSTQNVVFHTTTTKLNAGK